MARTAGFNILRACCPHPFKRFTLQRLQSGLRVDLRGCNLRRFNQFMLQELQRKLGILLYDADVLACPPKTAAHTDRSLTSIRPETHAVNGEPASDTTAAVMPGTDFGLVPSAG